MPEPQTQVATLSLVHIPLLVLCIIGTPLLAMGQEIGKSEKYKEEWEKYKQCDEIAHRIACHSVPGACKGPETNEVFEKYSNLESMIARLCVDGPKTFSESFWIDVNGAYQPYYVDKDGKTTKYPPE